MVERCKEGFFINETINHLVAYINYLSHENSFVTNSITNKVALKIANQKKICPITIDDDGKYVYHPNVCSKTHNPLEIIYSTITSTEERGRYHELYNNVSSISDLFTKNNYYKTDFFGIITLLRRIKAPSEYDSILSTIACVMLKKQNEGEVRRTLEFAQSISAAGVESADFIKHIRSTKQIATEKLTKKSDYTAPTAASTARVAATNVGKKTVRTGRTLNLSGGSKTRKNKKGIRRAN